MPVPNEEAQAGSEISQRDFTINDAHNTLYVIKCVFLRKGGISDGLVKSTTELKFVLDMITNTCGEHITIYEFFSNQDQQNED